MLNCQNIAREIGFPDFSDLIHWTIIRPAKRSWAMKPKAYIQSGEAFILVLLSRNGCSVFASR